VFVFQLALALGKTVRQIETEMDGVELQRWLVISNHFIPLPNPWLQTGVLAASNANFSGNVKRSHYPIKAESFVPKVKKATAWQVQKTKMQIYALKHPAKDKPCP
jgi:hypothetical protein